MLLFSPSLGSLSSLPQAGQPFHCLAVETDSHGQLEAGAVLEVWTDLTGEWKAHPSKRQATPSGTIYAVSIVAGRPGHFELTYRLRFGSGDIQWLSKAGGTDNGRIAVSGEDDAASTSYDPAAALNRNATTIEVATTEDIVARTIAFNLAPGEEGTVESFEVVSLGGFSSGLTVERYKPTWFNARTLDNSSGLSCELDSQLLLYRRGGLALACFPLSLPDASTTLRGCLEGSDTVWLRAERDTAGPAQAQCIVAWGPDTKLLKVVHACISQAKKAIRSAQKSVAKPDLVNGWHDDSHHRESLHSTRQAVFCTWNSLGQDYTFSGVLKRLDALKSSGSLKYYGSLLLDDGWQDVAKSPENSSLRCLRSFGTRDGWMDVNETATQGSALASAVKRVKKDYPEIKTIGVWMTLEGYWNGLHPDSETSKSYKLAKFGMRAQLSQYPYPPAEKDIYLPAASDIERFYSDYFNTLKKSGVDYVKIDNQTDLEYIVGEGAAEARRQISQTARAVAYRIFGPGNLINCMAGSPRYYNEFLSDRASPCASLRTSDDFFPFEADSHRFHIANNSTTAYLDRELSVTRDFDMFTSHHELAEYHALLRCFSTAPLYITDDQATNYEVLQQLGGRDRNGQYSIVKATENVSIKLPSTAFIDVTATGDGPALMVALPVSAAEGAIIGMWNCRAHGALAIDALTEANIAEALTLEGASISSDTEYVLIMDGQSPQLVGKIDVESVNARALKIVAPVNIAPGKQRTATVAPVKRYADFEMAVLGLQDKLVGLCAVLDVSQTKGEAVEEEEAPAAPSGLEATTSVLSSTAQANQGPIEPFEASNAPDEDESKQLLPKRRAQNQFKKGSRLLALLLFYRHDLRATRKSLLRELFAAPFTTLYREIRAAFGGPSTISEEDEEQNEENDAEQDASADGESEIEPAPMMQEAANSVPKTYGTFHDGQSQPAPADGMRGTVVQNTSDQPAVAGVDIVLSVAGELVVVIPGFSSDAFGFRLEGQAVTKTSLRVSEGAVVIDMESAIASLGLLPGNTMHENTRWRVTVAKKSTH